MPKNSTPIYLQINNKIKEMISSGKWNVGDRLPSERELAEYFSVSRMTLRQAIQTLSDEGILDRRVGSGTYVARAKVQEKMSGVTSFTEIIKSQGKTPSSKTISFKKVKPNSNEIKVLNLLPNDYILRMERIRFADDEPICFEVTSIPYNLIKGLSKSDLTKSLYESAEKKLNVKFGKAKQVITAANVSEKIGQWLNLQTNDAVLSLKQITYLDNGQPFEYVQSQYVGQRFEFVLEK